MFYTYTFPVRTMLQKITIRSMDSLCFVILRHVSTPAHNLYWNIAWKCVRAHYPDVPIYVIDDHSKCPPIFLGGFPMTKTTVIKSELPPNRGEFLPLYYFYNKRFARRMVYIHDTVFINAPIDRVYLATPSYHFLWTVTDSRVANRIMSDRPRRFLSQMSNSETLLRLYGKKAYWNIGFGGMGIYNLDFVSRVFYGTNYMSVLVRAVDCRRSREAYERVLGVILCQHARTKVIHGDITKSNTWLSNIKECTDAMKVDGGKTKMFKVFLARYGFVPEATPKKMASQHNMLMRGNIRPSRGYKLWTSTGQ